MAAAGRPRGGPRARRRAARLAAVQGLYQIEMSGADVERVLEEIHSCPPGDRVGDDEAVEAEREFLAGLLRGAAGGRDGIDDIVRQALAERWRVERLASVLRAVLRAAVCELRIHPETPARVVISEYLHVARAFFDNPEVGMVNGVLDSVARGLRPGEFGPRDGSP